MTECKSRCSCLDYLRFLSFGCIIFYHMVVQLWMDGIRDGMEVLPYFSNANIHIATLGVNLFFMISGAGLMLSGRKSFSLSAYYKKRFTRILVPFYVVWFLYFLVKLIFDRPVFPSGIPAWRIVFTVLGMDEYWRMAGIETFSLGIGEWFLGCIILMFLIFPLLRKIMLAHPWIVLGAATVYYILMVWYYPFTEIPVHQNFLVKIYTFLIGMFLGNLDNLQNPEKAEARNPKKTQRRILGALMIPVIAVCVSFLILPSTVLFNLLPSATGDEYRGTLFAGCVFLLFLWLDPVLSRPKRLNALLQKFSLYSYEIFLVHHVVIFMATGFFAGHRISLPLIIAMFAAEAVAMCIGGWIVKKICGWLIGFAGRLIRPSDKKAGNRAG